jgi:predicted transposase/invertase (TIGR01784 family)
MGKYLDPRADLTFKKVFGEHKNLVISLLNALLPLKDDERVESIEYWPADQIPERTEAEKYSIVDVCCKDNKQREFIVEMQMTWTESFKKRVLLNASKAYVAQTNKGMKYKNLQPVYALNFVNASFMKDVDDYYHYYHLVHDKYTDKVIDGLHLIFVELPKFKPQTISERKMQVLWLRYLTEIDENTREAPAELLENTEVNEALEILERAAFTDAEMRAYDKFWDRVSTMRTLESDWEDKIKEAKDKLNEMKAKAEEAEAKAEEAEAKAEEAEAKAEEAEAKAEEAEAKAEEAEAKEKVAKAKAEEAEAKAEEAKAELKQKDINTARRMKGLNVVTDVISQVTGLSNAEIEAL